MNATSSVLTVGRIASDLQRPVSEILRVAEQLGIYPSLVINGVKHFSDNDVDRISGHLRTEQRPEMETR